MKQREILDTMVSEYEFDPSHNQEDSLYSNLCEMYSAYQALEARHKNLLKVLNNQIKRGYPTGSEWLTIENEIKKASEK